MINKFKQKMTKKSNKLIIERDFKLIDKNQRAQSPIIDKFFGPIHRIHYNTYRQLKFFKAVDWYTKYNNSFGVQRDPIYFFFLGESVDELSRDVYPMIMYIRSSLIEFEVAVMREYPLATWPARAIQELINRDAIATMFLKMITFETNDQCTLYFESPRHGGELLKARFVFHTRKFTFNVD